MQVLKEGIPMHSWLNLQMKVQDQSAPKLNMSIYIRLIYVAVAPVLYVKTMRKSVNASGGMSCPH